jgi:hypothetical protein
MWIAIIQLPVTIWIDSIRIFFRDKCDFHYHEKGCKRKANLSSLPPIGRCNGDRRKNSQK